MLRMTQYPGAMPFHQRLLLLTAALGLSACSEETEGPGPMPNGGGNGGNGGSEDGGQQGDDVPLAELLDPLALDSTTAGALHGVVSVNGDVPERFPLGARKVADCKHHPDVEHLSDTLVVEEGKLCFAYLELELNLEGVAVPPPPSEPVVLDQRGCIYTPHVLGAQVGQVIEVSNSDPATHNVNIKTKRNRELNVSMAEGQAPVEYRPRRADTILFKCDIHPWMFANVHVCEHPWFAVSDEGGQFSIGGIPPGEYVLRIEHERLGVLRRRVVVRAGWSTGVALGFEAR
jgi:plastocyanin